MPRCASVVIVPLVSSTSIMALTAILRLGMTRKKKRRGSHRGVSLFDDQTTRRLDDYFLDNQKDYFLHVPSHLPVYFIFIACSPICMFMTPL